MEPESWLVLATLAISLLCYYLASLGSRSGVARRPPGPRPFPLIGNILDLRGDNLHQTLARLARAHGPVMRLKLGLTTAVVISSRDAAMEAFTRHDRRLTSRTVPDAIRALGFSERSMVWMASSNPRWKNLRGIVARHIFAPQSLAAARGVRERKVRDMVSCFRRRAGQEVAVGEVLYQGVLNLLTNALCSVDVGAESAHGIQTAVEDLIELIAKPNVSDLFPFLRALDLQGRRRYAGCQIEKSFRVLDGIIDRRLASMDKQEAGDFLDTLIGLMSTGKITREDVTAILFDLFSAGSDTTAITLEWTMAELLRNPNAMDKVRSEIKDALGSKEIVEEPDVVNLPYLQAVIKEAMRLHPVAPILLPHKADEDGVEISGYAVPKGSTVIFNVWAIMRDPAVWERPDEFLPERFLDKAVNVDFKGKDLELIPFGSGRRVCPGVSMAERAMPLILASMLHAYEWRLQDGMSADKLDVSEKFTTSNVMAVPLKAIPVVVT